MMKTMLISLCRVAIMTLLSIRYWSGTERPVDQGGAAVDPGASRFVRSCAQSSAHKSPQAYCTCLWEGGVRNMTALFTSKQAQAAARFCDERIK